MELYREHKDSSMEMAQDAALHGALVKLVNSNNIDVIIESGTFLGLGSTRHLSEVMMETNFPKSFTTIEASFSSWLHAKNNLRRFPFVDCRWGCSISIEEGKEFIKNDEMIVNHKNYSGIFIDDVDDPVRFYTDEICGALSLTTVDIGAVNNDLAMLWDGENVLPRLLSFHREHAPLIVLDSAGGIGLLEFQWVLRVMGDKPYFLLLDDTRHIKHIRSLQHLRKATDFEIYAEGLDWVLAIHPGTANRRRRWFRS